MFYTGANDLWLDVGHTGGFQQSGLHIGHSLLVCPGAELPDADGARARVPAARHLLCHAAMSSPDLGRQPRRHRTLLWPRQMPGASPLSLPFREDCWQYASLHALGCAQYLFTMAGLCGRQFSQVNA